MVDNYALRLGEKPSHQPSEWLLQLPDVVLHCVLQQLDQRSLACAAVTCSKLRHAVPASIRDLAIKVGMDKTSVLDKSFSLWVDHSSTRLTSVTYLSITDGSDSDTPMPFLPCTQLRQLHLKGVKVQHDPAAGCLGVLHYGSNLTQLQLVGCTMDDAQAAFAAIAALPALQHLAVGDTLDPHSRFLLPALQHMTELTHLDMGAALFFAGMDAGIRDQLLAQRPQPRPLSAMANLQHLRWAPSYMDNFDGVPGGLPSQLVKLTSLHISFKNPYTAKNQLQHLSSLTALQDLTLDVNGCCQTADLPNLEQLLKLKSLGLETDGFCFSTANISTWEPRSTALESLSLSGCDVEPAALAALTQLRTLRLAVGGAWPREQAASLDLLDAVSNLQLLTELAVTLPYRSGTEEVVRGKVVVTIFPNEPIYLTALTASSRLCSLQLGLQEPNYPYFWVLFRPGIVHSHMRHIDLAPGRMSVPLRAQQLQQLCSCCPALESLAFDFAEPPSATTLLPLLQLSALTQLGIHMLPQLTDPALTPLTALTALEELKLSDTNPLTKVLNTPLMLQNKARWCDPPDVWSQLLAHLGQPAA